VWADIKGHCNGVDYEIWNGGFPINLNRTPGSDTENDFILTRLLMFAAARQAAEALMRSPQSPELISLDPMAQQSIARLWLASRPDWRQLLGEKTCSQFDDLEWIARESAVEPAFVAGAGGSEHSGRTYRGVTAGAA
jgi:hypothetical protein